MNIKDEEAPKLIYLFRFFDGGQLLIIACENSWVVTESDFMGFVVERFATAIQPRNTFNHLVLCRMQKYKKRMYGTNLQAIEPPQPRKRRIFNHHSVIIALHVLNLAAALILLYFGILRLCGLFCVAVFFLLLFFDAFLGKEDKD